MPEKKPSQKCQRCGGELKLVAGLRVCSQCNEPANVRTDWRRDRDVPRDSGWKRPLIRDDD